MPLRHSSLKRLHQQRKFYGSERVKSVTSLNSIRRNVSKKCDFHFYQYQIMVFQNRVTVRKSTLGLSDGTSE